MSNVESITGSHVPGRLSDGTDPYAVLDFDAQLQASRRVDWRFLLPRPELEAVAYVGSGSATLLQSLHRFSRCLTVIEDPAAVGRQAGYDVVVLSGPGGQQLRQASRLVRPGGYLYIEVRRRLSGWGCPGFGLPGAGGAALARCRPAGAAAQVQRLGFRQVRTHWHWPDFEACTEIIALDDRRSLRHVLARRSGGPRGLGKFALRQCLWHSGLWIYAVRCFSLLAQRPDPEIP